MLWIIRADGVEHLLRDFSDFCERFRFLLSLGFAPCGCVSSTGGRRVIDCDGWQDTELRFVVEMAA